FRRALFARVIVQDAAIVLLDEPFAGIDATTSDDLLRLMRRWHGESRTVMVALHDLEQVLAVFPQTLLLARKAIAWGETATALTPENLVEAGLAAPPREPGPRLRLAMPS
ncbi:MAG: ABC transporter, partial [Solimonas sp.]